MSQNGGWKTTGRVTQSGMTQVDEVCNTSSKSQMTEDDKKLFEDLTKKFALDIYNNISSTRKTFVTRSNIVNKYDYSLVKDNLSTALAFLDELRVAAYHGVSLHIENIEPLSMDILRLYIDPRGLDDEKRMNILNKLENLYKERKTNLSPLNDKYGILNAEKNAEKTAALITRKRGAAVSSTSNLAQESQPQNKKFFLCALLDRIKARFKRQSKEHKAKINQVAPEKEGYAR